MTIVLVAVYVPIGFQGGLTGALFTEFAFTLAGAVTVSGIVALTLSPMMTSRFFRSEQESGRFVRFIDRQFDRLHRGYQRRLHGTLDTWAVPVVMGVILLGGVVYLFMTSKSELAPQEDQGVVLTQIIGPPNATSQQMDVYSKQVFDIARQTPGIRPDVPDHRRADDQPGLRRRAVQALERAHQERDATAAGAAAEVERRSPAPASPRSSFRRCPARKACRCNSSSRRPSPTRSSTMSRRRCWRKAQASGMFFYVDTDLKVDKPQTTVEVNRDLVATLGMTQQDVGAALGAALGGGYVNYFSIAGHSYKVIPQVLQADRLNASQVLDYHIRTADGSLVPASTVATQKTEVVPRRHRALPAAQLGDDLRRLFAGRVAEPGARFHAHHAAAGRAQRLFVRLLRRVAPVRAGIGRLRDHAAVRGDHRLPRARRAVRELPRSRRHSGIGAAGAVRCTDLHQPRLRDSQYLHAGRAGDADGPDQQARHPDRAVRQSARRPPARPSARRSRRPRQFACGRS